MNASEMKRARIVARIIAGEITLARYYAKKAVKEQWRAQGLKPQHIEASIAKRPMRTLISTKWSSSPVFVHHL